MYRLKPHQESFEVVDGPFAGKKFEKCVMYDAIPDQDAGKFDVVAPTPEPGPPVRLNPVPVSGSAPIQVPDPMPSWADPDPEPEKITKKGAKINA